MTPKKTLIYIASDVRAGSTLLDYLLSNNDEMISVGELLNLNDYLNRKGVGYSLDWRCSCGVQFQNCDFWSQVMEEFERNEQKKLKEIETKCSPFRRAWEELSISLLIFILPSKTLKRKLLKCFYYKKEHVSIIDNCNRILNYVCNVSYKKIVIDSSKLPDRVLSLNYSNQEDYSVKVIHLVRDARAVSFSKFKRGQQLNMKVSFLSAMVGWVIINLKMLNNRILFEKEDFVRIKYEDLCGNPTEMIRQICDQLSLPYNTNMTVLQKKEKHNIGGSQHRFEKSNEIKIDRRWKSNMNLSKQLVYFSTGYVFNKILGY